MDYESLPFDVTNVLVLVNYSSNKKVEGCNDEHKTILAFDSSSKDSSKYDDDPPLDDAHFASMASIGHLWILITLLLMLSSCADFSDNIA